MLAAVAAPSSSVAAAAANSGRSIPSFAPHSSSRTSVIASSFRKAKQNIARKELQKRAKEEYLRRIYEAADHVEEDQLVFELQPSSPRVRSQLQQFEQHAALNQQLAQQIPQLGSWQQLRGFMQHSSTLNFLNVVALVSMAALLQQQQLAASTPPGPSEPADGDDDDVAAAGVSQQDAAVADADLVAELSMLVLQHSSWFQPPHFVASAAALAALGVTQEAVWDNLTAAAEHKVGAFTFQQLAIMLEALAAAGFTPGLSWIERTYRQASKHLHAADAADIAVLMGAWGELGYTPRDRLYMNQVKILTRRAFDRKQLSGAELVQLMHGLARMPRYAPNQGWLAALAKATQRSLPSLTPGAVVDLLLSFVALDFKPSQPWMDAAMARLEAALVDLTSNKQQPDRSSLSSSGSGSEAAPRQGAGSAGIQHLQQQLLFLPPLDLQRLQQDLQLQAPGLLVGRGAGAGLNTRQQPQQLMEADELQELQALFDEAEEEEEEGEMEEQQAEQLQQEAAGGGGSLSAAQAAETPPAGAADAAAAAGAFAAQLRYNSAASSSDGLSLRRQLLQHQLAPEHVGVLCWCLGRLQFQPTRSCMQQLGQVLLLLLAELHPSPEVLVDSLLGCVAMGYLPIGVLQQQLLSQVLQCTPAMSRETLRRTCQALVALEAGLHQYEEHPAALASALLQQESAAAVAGENISEPLMQHQQQIAAAVVLRLGQILPTCTTAQIADVLAFVAAAGQTPSLDYMSAAVTRAVDKLPDGCRTPAVCMLLWALARMGFKPHPQLLHQLLAALQKGLHLLSSQDLADVGWALCTLRHRPGGTWLSLYLKEVAAKAGYMEAQALTDTLWALACFAAQPDREWLKLVVAAVGSKASAGALSPQNAAVAVWALQQLGLQPEQLVGGATAGGVGPASAAFGAGGGMGRAAVQHAAGGIQSAVLSLVQVVQQA